jgi:site-specific DNA-methyltransferase (adenine-specific)
MGMSEDVRIIHGDCLESTATLPDSSIDIILTDPPFSSGTRKEGSKGVRKSMLRGTEDDEWFGTDSLTVVGFTYLMRQNALEWRRVLKRGGHAFVFIDWRMAPHLAAAIESADLRHKGVITWDKTYFGMGDCFRNQHEFILHFTKGMGRKARRHDVGNVLSFPPVRDGDHPNEKPVPLLRELLSVVASPGDQVLDPFMGSAATGVAAALLNLSCTGIDNDATFVDVARTRLEKPPGERIGRPSLFAFASDLSGVA